MWTSVSGLTQVDSEMCRKYEICMEYIFRRKINDCAYMHVSEENCEKSFEKVNMWS